MDLTHLHLHVRDRTRAAAFYCRWFELRVVTEGAAITFMQGDRDFLFALMEDPAPAPMPPWFHFGIRLESSARVVDTMDAMAAAGVPIVKGLYSDDTLTSYRCADPEGYAIEVYWEPAQSILPPAA